MGSEGEWRPLEEQWLSRNGGKPFHAKDCDSDKGTYANPTNDDVIHRKNKTLYQDLTILLAKSGLRGFASCIDVAAHSAAFGHNRGTDAHYYSAFTNTIRPARDYARSLGDLADFTFDSRMESDHNAGLIYTYIRESHPVWKEHLGSKVSFSCSSNNPRIQVADLFSHEAMKEIDNVIGPKQRKSRKSWEALINTGRFVAQYTGREEAEIVAKDKNFMEEYIGFKMEDYNGWLREHGRQNSRTAQIDFIALVQQRRKEQRETQ